MIFQSMVCNVCPKRCRPKLTECRLVLYKMFNWLIFYHIWSTKQISQYFQNNCKYILKIFSVVIVNWLLTVCLNRAINWYDHNIDKSYGFIDFYEILWFLSTILWFLSTLFWFYFVLHLIFDILCNSLVQLFITNCFLLSIFELKVCDLFSDHLMIFFYFWISY